MPSKTLKINVEPVGFVIGRNGLFPLGAIQVEIHTFANNEEVVYVEGISKRSDSLINGGFHAIRVEDFDKVCIEYLIARNILSENFQGKPK